MKIDYKKYFISPLFVRIYTLILIVIMCITIIIQQMRTVLRELNPTQTTKLYLKGMINNPKSLLLVARLNIENGRYEQALIDLELAKGIYEINKMNYNEIQVEIIKLNKIIIDNKINNK